MTMVEHSWVNWVFHPTDGLREFVPEVAGNLLSGEWSKKAAALRWEETMFDFWTIHIALNKDEAFEFWKTNTKPRDLK